LQSGSTKPGAETIYSISYPTAHWSLRWMLPSALTMANLEKLSHKAELEKMQPLWSNIKVPVCILHGMEDKLIWPENAHFSKAQLVNAPWVELNLVPKRAHNLTWKSKELVCQKIVALLELAKARKQLKN
jgi:pimeloyl-ACP methyl ester carboxylesterase